MSEKQAKDLYPFGVFQADDGKTWLVSTYTLPQHPVCSCGPNKAYADMICNALSLIAMAQMGPSASPNREGGEP